MTAFRRGDKWVAKFTLGKKQHWVKGGPWDTKRQAQEAERRYRDFLTARRSDETCASFADRWLEEWHKAVDDTYTSSHGFTYKPGSTPEAPDWDGGKEECGGGLHACAHPWESHQFNHRATHYIACPVRLEDIAVHENAAMPNKVKFRACCEPCWEVDVDGEKVSK